MFVKAQCLEGPHRLLEPVSKTIWNYCGGVPIEIGP